MKNNRKETEFRAKTHSKNFQKSRDFRGKNNKKRLG